MHLIPLKSTLLLSSQIRLITITALIAATMSCGDGDNANNTNNFEQNANSNQGVNLSYKNSVAVATAVLFASRQTHTTFESLPGDISSSQKPQKTRTVSAYGTAASMAKQAACPMGGTYETHDSAAGSGGNPEHEPMRKFVYFNCGHLNNENTVQYVDGTLILNHIYNFPQNPNQDWSEKYEIKNNLKIRNSNNIVENYTSTQVYYIQHDGSTEDTRYKFDFFRYFSPNRKLINWDIETFVDKTDENNNNLFYITGTANYEGVGLISVRTKIKFLTAPDGRFLSGKMLITGNKNSNILITTSDEGDLVIKVDEQGDNLYESSSIVYHDTIFNSH